jgi:hypothetical protein
VNPNTTWLLPEGIDELLPAQARALEGLRRDLLDTYATWGYQLVITPFIEFLDALLTGTGRDLELQTFKLTDQASGRLLGAPTSHRRQRGSMHIGCGMTRRRGFATSAACSGPAATGFPVPAARCRSAPSCMATPAWPVMSRSSA